MRRGSTTIQVQPVAEAPTIQEAPEPQEIPAQVPEEDDEFDGFAGLDQPSADDATQQAPADDVDQAGFGFDAPEDTGENAEYGFSETDTDRSFIYLLNQNEKQVCSSFEFQ